MKAFQILEVLFLCANCFIAGVAIAHRGAQTNTVTIEVGKGISMSHKSSNDSNGDKYLLLVNGDTVQTDTYNEGRWMRLIHK